MQLLLELFNATISREQAQYQELLDRARECIEFIVSQPPIEIPENSPADNAFDPYISRRLNTSVPIRVITLPPLQETWKRVATFLDGLQEMKALVQTHNPTTWEVRVPFR